MRLTWRDWLATALLAGVLVLYALYLAWGGITFASSGSGAILFGINDPIGMAGVALLLGAAAAFVGEWIVTAGRAWFLVSSVTGVAAAVLGATVVMGDDIAANQPWDVQLAGFIALLVVLWALALGRRTGLLASRSRSPQPRRVLAGGA